jgi:hypothetical protein
MKQRPVNGPEYHHNRLRRDTEPTLATDYHGLHKSEKAFFQDYLTGFGFCMNPRRSAFICGYLGFIVQNSQPCVRKPSVSRERR